MMSFLSAQTATTLHDLILNSSDTALIEAFKNILKFEASSRKSPMAVAGLHMNKINDAALRDAIIEVVTKSLDGLPLNHGDLLTRNGSHIGLLALAGTLPDELVLPYYQFDLKAQAASMEVDYEQMKADLKAAFKGTVGRPGQPDFGVLMDVSAFETTPYSMVIGATMLTKPMSQSQMDDVPEDVRSSNYFITAIQQGNAVQAKGIDAKSVYILTPDMNAQAIESLAQLINFQGASHYLPQSKSAA